MPELTKDTLPESVATLFKLNNYDVEPHVEIHGAEVDLIAQNRQDPFLTKIYIEVTVEYVDTEKYGKDSSKFLLIRTKDPTARALIVSTKGFSAPVRERAAQSGVETLTYEDLFQRFQRFSPYISAILDTPSALKDDFDKLEAVYEEPNFRDVHGHNVATQYLTQWRGDPSSNKRWIVISGEYGTGKTALSKVLLRRWLRDYRLDPKLPIPFRIELRDFSRQFSARTLLHHFLDSNELGHVPVDFVLSLIRARRVVLLLDGYDEMAQYMHSHERRVCLQALADLGRDGVKGILTSRPNFFTEAEELDVLDTLYLKSYGPKFARSYQSTEQQIIDTSAVDDLFQAQFLERHERVLEDLTTKQSKSLVRRSLSSDPTAQATVLRLLDRVSRDEPDGTSRSLAGKPVIVSFLLEVAHELGRTPSLQDTADKSAVSEWQIYDLIVTNLMMRDYRISPRIHFERRRHFLQRLAVFLSSRNSGHGQVAETEFREMVKEEFRDDLQRAHNKDEELELLFSDLRRSTTLTRPMAVQGRELKGWSFSHNSIKEYLLASLLVEKAAEGQGVKERFPITDAMRQFVSVMPIGNRKKLLEFIRANWTNREQIPGYARIITLFWDGGVDLFRQQSDPCRALIRAIGGQNNDFSGVSLEWVSFAPGHRGLVSNADLSSVNFSGSELVDINFSKANLQDADFSRALLAGVKFTDCDMRGAKFSGASLEAVDITGADIHGADFRGAEVTMALDYEGNTLRGSKAVGLLSFLGGTTDFVAPIHVYEHHHAFPIVEKISRKILEGGPRQVRGLTQRGSAHADPRVAKGFLDTLVRCGWVVERDRRDELVEITQSGRDVLGDLVERRNLVDEIATFLDES